LTNDARATDSHNSGFTAKAGGNAGPWATPDR